MNLSGKIVLVTGSHGMLGQSLCPILRDRGASVLGVRSEVYDLTKPGHAHGLLNSVKPDLVVHAAAKVGGILANKKRPYCFARDNILMGTNLLDASIAAKVQKFVLVSTTCAYPSECPVPFREDMIWDGYPEPTNAPYAIAKRTLGMMVDSAVAEGLLPCATTAILANLYGPNDNFHPETSHCIPALIRKFQEAVDHGLTEVVCWGSGVPTRDFLFVRDAAEGIARVCESWDVPYCINLGTGIERSISNMAVIVADAVGYKGEIKWAGDSLDGQRRRALDTGRAWTTLQWKAMTEFRQGIENTVRWWRENRG